jgi:hypothetical protein
LPVPKAVQRGIDRQYEVNDKGGFGQAFVEFSSYEHQKGEEQEERKRERTEETDTSYITELRDKRKVIEAVEIEKRRTFAWLHTLCLGFLGFFYSSSTESIIIFIIRFYSFFSPSSVLLNKHILDFYFLSSFFYSFLYYKLLFKTSTFQQSLQAVVLS